jgi:hypothetical protein
MMRRNKKWNWRKVIAQTVKRTASGLKRGARLAWKMTKGVVRSVRDVTGANSRATHQAVASRSRKQKAEGMTRDPDQKAWALAKRAAGAASASTKVSAHGRTGSNGVKAHSRKLTPNQKQQAVNDQILRQKQ